MFDAASSVLYSQYEKARDEYSQEEWERRLTEKLSKYVLQKLQVRAQCAFLFHSLDLELYRN